MGHRLLTSFTLKLDKQPTDGTRIGFEAGINRQSGSDYWGIGNWVNRNDERITQAVQSPIVMNNISDPIPVGDSMSNDYAMFHFYNQLKVTGKASNFHIYLLPDDYSVE